MFKHRKDKKNKKDKAAKAEQHEEENVTHASSAPKDISPVSPDVRASGSPKSSRSKLSSTPPGTQITKAEDDAQEDERTEERKSFITKMSGLVGKDIASVVSLPVSFFEPLSVLQSMAEPLRHAELLNEACACTDPVERLCRVAAFCVGLFSYYVRTAKPFNPVLGETFEFEPASKQYKTLAEQVSHHPPIGICHSVSEDWVLSQESRIETKFWGTSVEVNSLGNNILTLTKLGEEIRWKNPSVCIHNIILGRLWVEHHGTMSITNHTTGHTSEISFKKHSWFSSRSFEVSGDIKDKDGKVKASLIGNWKDDPYVNMIKVDENGKKGDP